ncbi:MAG TPA: CBS domain-containing protein [Saprospiraceae bacterium]|nr:CBS domain-containing protein [Saprospiraceae bacterium]
MISVQKLLAGKKINQMITLSPDNTVIEALQVMSDKNIGAIMIMDGENLVGIFSERDYARKGIIQGRKAKSTPLTEVMIHEVITVTPEMDIDDCMQLFIGKYIRHLPVVKEGRVIGMLSIGDIVNAIIQEQTDHIKFLEQYITGG